jgi:hypothetical protein
VTLTADSVAGPLRVSASLPQTNVAPVLFSAVVNPGLPWQLLVIQQPSPVAQATVRLARQPQLQVADQFGNGVKQSGIEVWADMRCTCDKVARPLPTGLRSSASRSLPSGGLAARISAPTSIGRAVVTRDTITRGVAGTRHVPTDANGIATFTDLALNVSTGIWQLFFFDGNESLRAAVSDDITVSAGPAMSIVATSDTMVVLAGGDSVRPEVQVIDAVGNGIAGVTITWDNKQGTQGRLDSTTTRTDARGYATPGRWIVPTDTGRTFVIVATPVGLSLENAPLALYVVVQPLSNGLERVPVTGTRVASALPVRYFPAAFRRSNATLPPTTVITIRASRIVSGAIVVRSRSMITKSASIPFTSTPFSASANSA